jgi:bacillithiol biosynthesis deacetylase BshB1
MPLWKGFFYLGINWKMMKLDLLVFAAHPDDAELTCSGTLARHVAQGRTVGIVDLTRGEMGTRGNVDLRAEEAAASSEILGLTVRENLALKDVYFENGREEQLALIRVIRKYQPTIVLANAVKDRHPDHGRAAALVREAVFMAGLAKLNTELDGAQQKAFRPNRLYHFIQSDYIEPDFLVDVSDYWAKKIASIRAFKSQFYDPNANEPDTYISAPDFLDFIDSRARAFGQRIGVKYAEGFTVNQTPGIRDLFDLI